MWINAILKLVPYKPLRLEKGMMFIRIVEGVPEMYELNHSVSDIEAYMTANGCPINLSLIAVYNDLVIAEHNEIAWVDEGDDSDEMHEITIDDINSIIRNDCKCLIKIKAYKAITEYDNSFITPVFDEEKVIIKLIEEEE